MALGAGRPYSAVPIQIEAMAKCAGGLHVPHLEMGDGRSVPEDRVGYA